MFISIAIILLVIGSVAFHFLSPSLGLWFTPIASNWGNIDDTVILTFVVTGAVFVAVNLFMAYAIIRYRHRKGGKAHYEPESTKLEWWLTIFTTVGVVAMLAPGLSVWNDYVTVPDDAMVVEAVGQQWQWTYRFPGTDGILGTADTKLITSDNPFGVNPNDPRGLDDVLIEDSELHLPIGGPIKVALRSKDVLHDFFVPQFRAKMDLVPGLITYFWFTPTKLGEYEILCAELCGVGHYTMRGTVIIDEDEAFQAWLSDQATFGELLAESQGATSVVAEAEAAETKE